MKLNRELVVLIDFQYLFGNNNQLFPKEMAIMEADTFAIDHIHFYEPYPEEELSDDAKIQNNFNKKKINNLDWNDGTIPYYRIKDVLSKYADEKYTVFVKGFEKKTFLTKYLDNVCMINMPGRLNDYVRYKTSCPIHMDNSPRCAVLHVIQMFMYLEKNDKLE